MNKGFIFLLSITIAALFFLVSVGYAAAQANQVWKIIIGNPESTQDDPSTDPGGNDVSFGPVPSCADIEQELKNNFGVTVVSGGSSSWCGYSGPQAVDCQTRQAIWRALAAPSGSSGYRAKLKKYNPWTLQCFTHEKGPSFASGCVSSGNVMNVKNCEFYRASQSGYNFFILHETGHIIGARNSRLYQSFPVVSLAASDSSCYDGLFIKTYSLRTTTARNESFAEATAFYVYNEKTNITNGYTISNFRRACNNTYEWMRNNVYDDYEF